MSQYKLTINPITYNRYYKRYYTQFLSESTNYKCDTFTDLMKSFNKSIEFWEKKKPLTQDVTVMKPNTASRYVVCHEAISNIKILFKEKLEKIKNETEN